MATATRTSRRTGTQTQGGQPTATYFRTLFKRFPTWVNLKDNTQILDQYRVDHNMSPDAVIDKKTVANLSNLKSQLRNENKANARRAIGAQTIGSQQAGQPFPGYQTTGQQMAAGQQNTVAQIDALMESLEEQKHLLRVIRVGQCGRESG